MKAGLVAAAILVCLPGQPWAGVSSAGNSTVPIFGFTCPAGDLGFQIVVRDAANNPVRQSVVVISLQADPSLNFCFPPATCASPTSCRITAVTDDRGVADFRPAGAGWKMDRHLVVADGVLLGNLLLASVDQNGDLVVDETDLAVAAAAESLLGAGRSDFDGSGFTDSGDLEILRSHLGHGCGPGLGQESPADGVWLGLRPSMEIPGREGHSLVFDPLGDRAILFGGARNATYGILDELWALDLYPEPAWKPIVADGWEPRIARHSAVYIAEARQMVVFSGFTWVLTLDSSPRWETIGIGPLAPRARFAHAAVYDRRRDRMLVMGGSWEECYWYSCLERTLDEVWELPLSGPAAWRRVQITGRGPVAGHWEVALDEPRDRLIVYSPGEHTTYSLRLEDPPQWVLLEAPSLPVNMALMPGARLVADPLRDRVLLTVNALDLSLYQDSPLLFSLDLSAEPPTWRRLQPVGGPMPAIEGDAWAHDPIGDRILVFGGSYRRWWMNQSHYPMHLRWLQLGPPPRVAKLQLRGDEEAPVQPRSRGTLSASLFGSESVDVGQIDLETVRMAGAPIRLRGGGEPMASLEDLDGDGYPDLQLHFDIQDLALLDVDQEVLLHARLHGGGSVVARAAIRMPGGSTVETARGAGTETALAAEPAPEPRPIRLAIRSVDTDERGISLGVTLPRPGPATLEAYDVGGRKVAEKRLAGPDEMRVTLSPRMALGRGLYFVRLRQGDQTVTRRVVRLR